MEWKRLILAYPSIEEGSLIPLWTDDADEENKYDPLVYEGTFIYDQNSRRWGFKIDETQIEQLSKSTKFAGYTINEVMGEDYEKEKKAHPEFF